MYKKLEECPLCGEREQQPFVTCRDHSVSQQSFSIVECSNCHFRFTNPRPGDDELGSFYESEEYISHNNSTKSLFNRLYKLARLFTVRKKVSLINRLASAKSRLLDYGCGTGAFVAAAREDGWKATGIEPNEKARSEARKNKAVTFHSGLHEINAGEQFEIITLWHVLEHVANLNETVEALKNLLADGGKMLIAVPNNAAYDEKIYEKNWAAYDVPRHLYHFTQPTFKKLMAGHQLKVEKIIPMKLDALYVSILSEKYLNNHTKNSLNTISFLKGILNGLKSNHWAKDNDNNYSSLIYVIAK